jgi:PadR family transcriptional regulator PadR
MMKPPPRDVVQGTLDMLILKALDVEPRHGYGITVRLEQMSRGVFRINPGSLFPAFRRLERDGLVASAWGTTEHNRRAKYYALTRAGRARLNAETGQWERQVAAIARILASA